MCTGSALGLLRLEERIGSQPSDRWAHRAGVVSQQEPGSAGVIAMDLHYARLCASGA